MRGDEQSVTNSSKLFHARGPATAKDLSPSVERRVAGTTRADDEIMMSSTEILSHHIVCLTV